MITTMFRRVGNDRIYIHGHLNNQEMAAYQLEGWRMHVPSKPTHKKSRNAQQNKHGISVEKGVGSREMQKV
ncbi:hypothetical protein [Sporosarcina sp. FA9]|uniref:hypothetical protein n=1 Tax=Sporosarcina sp. FA9 TaxID=3413030 RepID=UPI003F65F816